MGLCQVEAPAFRPVNIGGNQTALAAVGAESWVPGLNRLLKKSGLYQGTTFSRAATR
jgi:hypothetical protein